jgi:hypothetical protein
MKDVRQQQKAERNFYRRVPCAACGRIIARRKGFTCSRACQEKLEGKGGGNGSQTGK